MGLGLRYAPNGEEHGLDNHATGANIKVPTTEGRMRNTS